jgi:hypothetical protein
MLGRTHKEHGLLDKRRSMIMFIRANTFPVQPGKTDEAVNVFRDSVALICQKQVPRENDMTTHKP